MRPVEEAKQRLALPDLMMRLGLGEHAMKSAGCPFHEDRHNSFSVWRNDAGLWLWKCHTGCGQGDEIDFLARYKNISKSDAIKLFLEMAGPNGATPAQSLQHRGRNKTQQSPLNWTACIKAFTQKGVEWLAKWRGYSIEFCAWLKQSRLVGLHDNCIAFPVHDRTGYVVAVHYRLKDGSWRYFPQGRKVRPLVIGELVAGESVHAFESQWDGFAFADKSGERSGIIITRGAGNGALVSGLIPESSTVYLWTQNDAAGEKWQRDICVNTEVTVKRAEIAATYKDLNDWTQAGATPDDLLAAMMRAEEVSRAGTVTSSTAHESRETETNWLAKIDAATVSSSELASLTLNKRRPLLGDWLCEGDYGIIFAPRGVGKTWLGLMIAKAVATCGHVGEWKAPAPAKVLYIDGEMPADLMRDRDRGLGSGEVEFLNHAILFDRTERVLNITEPAVQEAILQRCIRDNTRLVILDNLSTLASGIKENDSFEWERLHNWLLQFRRHKIAVILINHAGRSGEIRGTSKREDAAFWVIALDDAKKHADDKRGARFITRFTKPSRNTQDEIASYEWHVVTDPVTGQVSVGCELAQTLDVLRQLIEDGVTECNQLAQEMRVTPGTISKWAKKGMKEGWLRKKGREYELVEDGNEGNENE